MNVPVLPGQTKELVDQTEKIIKKIEDDLLRVLEDGRSPYKSMKVMFLKGGERLDMFSDVSVRIVENGQQKPSLVFFLKGNKILYCEFQKINLLCIWLQFYNSSLSFSSFSVISPSI